MTADDAWAAILKEALDRAVSTRDSAVPGARLRLTVDAVARERGLTFPPLTEPELRFGEFVGRYPTVAMVKRRPGRDFLAVPADRQDLFVDAEEGVWAGIRSDLFEAFTLVKVQQQPWYHRGQDEVVWLRDDCEKVPAEFVRIPRASFETEGAVRRSFAGTLSDAEVRAQLEAALEKPQALTEFSAAVKCAGLQKGWHIFRTRELLERIKGWSRYNNLPMQDNWITSTAVRRSCLVRSQPSAAGRFPHEVTYAQGTDLRGNLAELADCLDESDLARITVPFDLLLKVIARKR